MSDSVFEEAEQQFAQNNPRVYGAFNAEWSEFLKDNDGMTSMRIGQPSHFEQLRQASLTFFVNGWKARHNGR